MNIIAPCVQQWFQLPDVRGQSAQAWFSVPATLATGFADQMSFLGRKKRFSRRTSVNLVSSANQIQHFSRPGC